MTGFSLSDLARIIAERARNGDPQTSHTAKLLSEGVVRTAKKFGEEAVEAAIAAVTEVVEIYLPLSRLLSLHVAATQGLHEATRTFLGTGDGVTPFIIGLAVSVAVGKSTTSRVLRALLQRWPNTPKVELIATDGFLLPNAVLKREGLMERKGFPESYDLPALLAFLSDIKGGKKDVTAPVYSHLSYD